METVGLLGTSFTMEKPFYRQALAEKGITVIVPEADDRRLVNEVIYNELVAGVIRDESRRAFVSVIHRLARRGAEGVILGCTEIPLLIGEEDAGMPLFDTTVIHAEAALRYAVNGSTQSPRSTRSPK
jgi:aspartate racemase